MLCNTELMHVALVSLTGELVQAGVTCGGTFTGGFAGGTTPLAPAVAPGRARTASEDATMHTVPATARTTLFDRAYPPEWYCITAPPGPHASEWRSAGER